MRRREFVAFLGGALIAWPFTTMAEELRRVGVLVPTDRATAEQNLEAFRKGLREIGYVEGQNLAVEYRFAEERDDRLPELAAELVQLNVKIIVTWGTPAGFAAKNATSTIPIVMATAGDPVGTGLVSTLARPGGNITGQSSIAPDMGEKTLGLLREVAPGAYRIAILLNPTNPFSVPTLKQVEIAAHAIRAKLKVVGVRHPDELESAFSSMAAEGAEALIVVNDLIFLPNAKRIAALAIKSRLPTVFIRREYVEAGGLMSYGPNNLEQFRRTALYVDKLLRGANPGEIPVEQPTKFELVINLKAANALGLTVPPSLLARADEVIE
jgi:putative tryptophan/tyrosine transport system substrate-binding protein